ncbi:hypothetical protein K470DRAFT_134592 [Piedraia hortae CBS 480.64]|uniref:Uncharacterized protein n=1 Tax=Piedraia hortae CBS 480.64 TaxID=1314780 RepID=A0A6A7BTP0_9PEZI|nr:hypothetical protein K470DRAFT_134592 [Piedraia hortae CBS 480.64]
MLIDFGGTRFKHGGNPVEPGHIGADISEFGRSGPCMWKEGLSGKDGFDIKGRCEISLLNMSVYWHDKAWFLYAVYDDASLLRRGPPAVIGRTVALNPNKLRNPDFAQRLTLDCQPSCQPAIKKIPNVQNVSTDRKNAHPRSSVTPYLSQPQAQRFYLSKEENLHITTMAPNESLKSPSSNGY